MENQIGKNTEIEGGGATTEVFCRTHATTEQEKTELTAGQTSTLDQRALRVRVLQDLTSSKAESET